MFRAAADMVSRMVFGTNWGKNIELPNVKTFLPTKKGANVSAASDLVQGKTLFKDVTVPGKSPTFKYDPDAPDSKQFEIDLKNTLGEQDAKFIIQALKDGKISGPGGLTKGLGDGNPKSFGKPFEDLCNKLDDALDFPNDSTKALKAGDTDTGYLLMRRGSRAQKKN